MLAYEAQVDLARHEHQNTTYCKHHRAERQFIRQLHGNNEKPRDRHQQGEP